MNNVNLEQIKVFLEKTLNLLKDKNLNKEFFDKFVGTIKISSVNGNNVQLVAINNFAKQVIENDFLKDIENSFNSISGDNYIFNIVSENQEKVNYTVGTFVPIGKFINVNKEYNFDNFVVGDFNRSSCLAGKQITSENFISPLFISAGVGLGKTHLLHAIGNEYHKSFPNKNVKYISSDDFSREVYGALISEDKSEIEKIKNEYFSYDLLLIDDIQILSGRSKINEILFNIFNNAIQNKKIIVFTSDKNIDLMVGFEERMKSRFHSGITLTILKPSIESVIDIINKKMEENNKVYTLSSDAINFIARRNTNDIRRLMGDINQILFYCINNIEKYHVIDLETVKKIIAPTSTDEINSYGYDIDPNIVIDQICSVYSVRSDMVKSKSKLKALIMPRCVCMYVLREKFKMTYSQIGQFFSGRDHSTVMSSIEKIEKVIKSDMDLKANIENIYKKI